MDGDLRNRLRDSRGSRPQPARPVAARPVSVSRPTTPRSTAKKNTAAEKLGYAAAHDYKTPPHSNYRSPTLAGKRSSKKKILLVVLALIVLSLGGAAYWLTKDGGKNNPYALGSGEPNPGEVIGGEEIPKTQPTGSIRFIATGDMIAHDSVNANAKKADGSYDYVPLMAAMKPYFEKADIRFCNQATPAGGPQFGITGYPSFNAPVEFARGLEGVGCNLINIGTNHTNDKGQPLIDATVAAWDDRQGILAVAGANRSQGEQSQVRYFTVKGVKFAFLSYSTYSNNTSLTPYGVNMYSEPLATAQVGEARSKADVVIVSMRWGTEYSPSVNAQQDQIAQKLTDLGADVVLGHGPHVLEPVKKLKSADGKRESIVWYSLGNFLNTQLETEALIGGFAIMDIDVATKKVSTIKFMPTYMHYEWTAAEKRAENLLARRSLAMAPLDQAKELLAKSQLGTSVEAQTERVRGVLNQFTPITIIKASEY